MGKSDPNSLQIVTVELFVALGNEMNTKWPSIVASLRGQKSWYWLIQIYTGVDVDELTGGLCNTVLRQSKQNRTVKRP